MYWINETGNNHNRSNWRSFIADNLTDVQGLPDSKRVGTQMPGDSVSNQPCAIGSECLCLEDASVWILGSDDVWKKL